MTIPAEISDRPAKPNPSLDVVNTAPTHLRRSALVVYACICGLLATAKVSDAQSVAADLSLTSTVSTPSPVVDTNVTFQVVLRNAGPNAAQRIVVRDRLPGGYTYVSHSVARGTYDPIRGQWSGFGVAANASATLTLVATVKADGNHVDVAEVLGSSAADPDSTPNNGNVNEDDYTQVTTMPVSPQHRPDILVIMLDDVDVRSLRDMLDAGLMPNLRSGIIDRAVELSEAYVSTPLCCPSRATYLTGKYPHNTGIVSNELYYPGFGIEHAVGQFDDTVTIATRLRALGYTTGHIGKYLNGYGSDATLVAASAAFDPHYVPPGWSEWSGLIDYSTYCVYNYTLNSNGALTSYMLPLGQLESTSLYQTNVLAGLAESFAYAHRSDSAPFYLEIMPLAAHAEKCPDAYGGNPAPEGYESRIRPAPEDAAAVVPSFVPGPAYDEDVADKPSWLSGTPALTASDYDNIATQYQQRLRSLLAVDRLIGRVITALGPRREDTVIVFTSDNGWMYGDHRSSGKIYAYQESARVPLYVSLPGARTSAVRTNLVLNNDLTPTLLDLAAPGYADPAFDGRSLVPILLNAQPPGWQDRKQFLIEYSRSLIDDAQDSHPTYSALRSRSSLYVESYSGVYFTGDSDLMGLELYDLASDPHELSSLLQYPHARDPVRAPKLDQLLQCAGPECGQYENAGAP